MKRLREFFSGNPRVLFMRALGRIHSAMIVAVVCCAVSEILGHNALLSFFRGLLFCIPMTLSWYAVRNLKNMGQFLLASLGLMALAWLLMGNPGGAAAMVLVTILRARARLSEEKEESYMDYPLYFLLIFFAAAFFLSAFLDLPVLQRVSLICAAVYFLLCVLYRGVGRVERYLYINRDMHGMPTRRILRTAGSAVLLAAALSGALLLPVAVSSTGDFHLDLPDHYTDPTERAEDFVGEAEPQGDPMGTSAFELLAEGAPTWHIPAFVSYLFYAAVGVGLAALVLHGVTVLFKNFRITYTDSRDVVQFLRGDRDDGDAAEAAEHVRKPRIWDRSPNATVRRRYRKEILRAAGETPARWQTPAELEDWAGITDPQLHALYEKARYGKDGCTQEDVRALKR